MARKLRLEYAGAIYHVMSRGDRREPIFKDDDDRKVFLKTLGEACGKTGWEVHAFCLMDNHFHMVVETPAANLVAGMKWFLGTYTGRFNRRHREFGHLFSGRYKALLVDGSWNGYLKTVCNYVHLNPARARLVKRAQPLEHFHWSSYPLYLVSPGKRPAWLRVDRLLGEWHIPQDTPAGRRAFAAGMEARRADDMAETGRRIERGWFVGSEEFRQELLAQVAQAPGASHFGESVQEAVAVQAERLIQERLKALGWREQDLAARRKGDPAKVKLAATVRAHTTMPLAWIAQRLAMGSRGYLTWLLHRQGQQT